MQATLFFQLSKIARKYHLVSITLRVMDIVDKSFEFFAFFLCNFYHKEIS